MVMNRRGVPNLGGNANQFARQSEHTGTAVFRGARVPARELLSAAEAAGFAICYVLIPAALVVLKTSRRGVDQIDIDILDLPENAVQLKLLRAFRPGEIAVEGAKRKMTCFAGQVNDQAVGKLQRWFRAEGIKGRQNNFRLVQD